MQLVLAKEAQKQYKRLSKPEQTKIKSKISLLAEQPFIGKKLEGDLTGYRSLRAWPYRIIYSINQQQSIVIIKSILHRQGVYK